MLTDKLAILLNMRYCHLGEEAKFLNIGGNNDYLIVAASPRTCVGCDHHCFGENYMMSTPLTDDLFVALNLTFGGKSRHGLEWELKIRRFILDYTKSEEKI